MTLPALAPAVTRIEHIGSTAIPGLAAKLAFRDHMRAHPDDAERYAALERRLAGVYTNARDPYTDAKSDFVRDILERSEAPARAGGAREPAP